MWDASWDSSTDGRRPVATLVSVVSEDERHTSRRTAPRASVDRQRLRGAAGMGRAQRQMLLVLYEREARARAEATTSEDARALRILEDRGIPWKPKSMLRPNAAYTATRAEEMSRTLRSLEERGLVKTHGSAPPLRRRTRSVRLTDLGRHEARQLAARDGQSQTAFDHALGVDELRRALDRARRRLRRARARLRAETGAGADVARDQVAEAERECAMWRELIDNTYEQWTESKAERDRELIAALRRLGHLK